MTRVNIFANVRAQPVRKQRCRHRMWRRVRGGQAAVGPPDQPEVLGPKPEGHVRGCPGANAVLAAVRRISEVSLAVGQPGRGTAAAPPARLIERCECPAGHSGLSCEVSRHRQPARALPSHQPDGNTSRTIFAALRFPFLVPILTYGFVFFHPLLTA